MGSKRIKQLSNWEAWVQILRVSNAPTIISNVLVGIALAIQSHNIEYSHLKNPPPLDFIKPALIVSIILLCIYFGGMILNDAFDVSLDKERRPERPIPQGIITAKTAWSTGLCLLAVSILFSLRINVETIVSTCMLSACVLLYTFLHHRMISSIVLMGVCRALVYVTAFTAFFSIFPTQLIGYCIAIAVYTGLLTCIGKSEHLNNSKNTLLLCLMYLNAIIPAFLFGSAFSLHWFVLFVFICWITLAIRYFNVLRLPKQGMHTLLSGFCLLDCVFLATMQEYSIMIVSFICFVFTVAMHRKVSGT